MERYCFTCDFHADNLTQWKAHHKTKTHENKVRLAHVKMVLPIVRIDKSGGPCELIVDTGCLDVDKYIFNIVMGLINPCYKFKGSCTIKEAIEEVVCFMEVRNSCVAINTLRKACECYTVPKVQVFSFFYAIKDRVTSHTGYGNNGRVHSKWWYEDSSIPFLLEHQIRYCESETNPICAMLYVDEKALELYKKKTKRAFKTLKLDTVNCDDCGELQLVTDDVYKKGDFVNYLVNSDVTIPCEVLRRCGDYGYPLSPIIIEKSNYRYGGLSYEDAINFGLDDVHRDEVLPAIETIVFVGSLDSMVRINKKLKFIL